MKHYVFSLLSVFSLFVASNGFAQAYAKPLPTGQNGPTARVLTLDPVAESNMLAQTGGSILPPNTGPSILILNIQKKVADSVLQATTTRIQNLFHLPCTFVTKRKGDAEDAANHALADKKTAAVIVIHDTPDKPSLLVAPESRWALINVGALSTDASAEKTAARVDKELWRAFGYLMGAANTSYEHCLLKPVFSCDDLDALTCTSLSPEPIPKFLVQARRLGMKPVRLTTYRKAVEEGWAPAPTNEFQRAIWNERKK